MPRSRKLAELASSASLDLLLDDIRVLLLITASAITPDTQFVGDISADEAIDASYARQALTGRSLTWDAVNDRLELTHDNVDYGNLDGDTPTFAVYYRHNAVSDATREILGYLALSAFPPDGLTPWVLVPGSEGVVWL